MSTSTEEIRWEEDPKVFIFNEDIPGRTKMHTKKMDIRDWIKIDKTYIDQIKLKKEITRKYGKKEVFVSNYDDSAVACKWELFEMLVDYLPKRFPDLFELRSDCIYSKVLKEAISTRKDEGEDPLIRLSNLTQEDWVIIEWNDEEQGYVCTSGIVHFPMRWSLQEKFNQSIAGIHIPVKPFTKHLQPTVYDIFKKMSYDAPLWRANWAVFNDLDGPLDLYTPLGHENRNDVNKTTVFEGDKTGKILTFRAEYQTLRKLPKTKCIVFSIRTYQRYLEEFKDFPISDCKGLIKAIETLGEDFTIYKGASFWKDAALQYLRYIIENRTKQPRSDVKTSLFDSVKTSWILPATVVLGSVLLAGLFLNRTK